MPVSFHHIDIMIHTGDDLPLFSGKKRQKIVQTGKIRHGGVKVNLATKRLTDATAAGVCLLACHVFTHAIYLPLLITNLLSQGLVAPLKMKGGGSSSSPKVVSHHAHKILPLSFKRLTKGSYLLGVSEPPVDIAIAPTTIEEVHSLIL